MQPLSIGDRGPYPAFMGQTLTLADQDDATLARRIMAAAPARDALAEAELCRRFAPRIRLYGRKYLRSEAAAADLVQDVLMMTLEKLRAGTVREPGRLASFILGTCRQMVIDGKRSTMRRERILEAFPLDLAAGAEEAAEPLDTERLQKCLERLPERERAVLVMTFYDDRPADAVGKDLGLSPANVRVIRHRGLERLRGCVEAPRHAS